jgi:uncharacterized protein YyaL (SSP411 family)
MKTAALLLAALLTPRANAADPEPGSYGRQAREVMEHIQKTFWNEGTGLYAESETKRHPDFMWPNGVMFTALVAAARHEPETYRPVMERFFTALDAYWDAKAKVPGYEPSPVVGGTGDKYYDDNAWMVITFLEAHELTKDERYRVRAEQALRLVLSGWDDRAGGGIWWHEGHKDGAKNTCVNAPAAVGCLRLALVSGERVARQLDDRARRLVAWTVGALQADDGLFHDRVIVATGAVKRGKMTYNAGLMIRAFLGLHRATGERAHLDEARRIARAAEALVNPATGAYRDPLKWSHLLVEADLELYRETGEAYLLERARKNAAVFYAQWKSRRPADMMANASLARLLWLMADTETR